MRIRGTFCFQRTFLHRAIYALIIPCLLTLLLPQAVADGHVLDVLQHYTSLTAHLQIRGLGLGGTGRIKPPTTPSNGTRGGANGGGARKERGRGEDEEDEEGGAEEGADEGDLVEAAHGSRGVVVHKARYIAGALLAACERARQAGYTEMRAMVRWTKRRCTGCSTGAG